jgi:hypothetical protein
MVLIGNTDRIDMSRKNVNDPQIIIWTRGLCVPVNIANRVAGTINVV